MTVHPFRPADSDDRDPFGEAVSAEEAAAFGDRLEALLAKLADEPDDQLDELIDGLPDTPNRFGSFDLDHRLAHRAVAPGLLAGLCRLDLELCQLFHAAVFELLEDVGDFDGLIATRYFFVDTGTRRMREANEWTLDHPAPPDDDSQTGRDAVADHSQELALAIGSNPSLTFASIAAVRERLLDRMLDLGPNDLVVSDDEIDWLIDLTFRLLAELRHDVAAAGGGRLWAAERPRSSDN